MSGLTTIIARTGHIDEIRERTVGSIIGTQILEADDEQAAIRLAVEKFSKTVDKIQTMNPEYMFNPKRVGALEIWSDDDLIGWEIDSEFYEV